MVPLKIIVLFSEFCSNRNKIIFSVVFINILQCNTWPNKRREAHFALYILIFKQDQSRFYKNYMQLFEKLSLFILHLENRNREIYL